MKRYYFVVTAEIRLISSMFYYFFPTTAPDMAFIPLIVLQKYMLT
jgi:hypothetical protein